MQCFLNNKVFLKFSIAFYFETFIWMVDQILEYQTHASSKAFCYDEEKMDWMRKFIHLFFYSILLYRHRAKRNFFFSLIDFTGDMYLLYKLERYEVIFIPVQTIKWMREKLKKVDCILYYVQKCVSIQYRCLKHTSIESELNY